MISKGKEELVISKICEELNKENTKPKEFIYRLILYIAYMCLGDDKYLDEIIENSKKLIVLAKKYEKEDSCKHTEIQLNLAIAYARKQMFDNMHKENYKLIREIQSTSKIAADIKRSSYHLQAIYYLNNNNIPYAMGYLEKASQYDENNFEILFNMALIYFYTEKDIHKCLECIEKIDRTTIENDEHFRLLVVMQYYCLSLEKRYSEAYEIINGYHLSELSLPIHMKGHEAYIAYKMKYYHEAKVLVDDVLQKEFDATSMNVRAMLQIRDGLYEEALSNLTKIIPDFTKDNEKYYLGEIYYNLSFVNLKLNNVEEAIANYQRANDLGFVDYDSDYIVELDIAQTEFLANNADD